MTVPVFSSEELLSLLNENGWVVVANEFWDATNRIIIRKEDAVLTIETYPKYFYFTVVKICEMTGITPPEEHIHAYYRHLRLNDKKCYCGRDLAFKDCHGKND